MRPEINVETALWPLRPLPIKLDVISFGAEAFRRPPEVASKPCANLTETLAEKFVALTRRAGAELADAGGPRDKTLVRHIYDLHMAMHRCDPAELVELVREVIRDDGKAYGRQFPAYRNDPIAESLKAVDGLARDERFARGYSAFLRDMVYRDAPAFSTALETISALADTLRA